MAGSVFGKQFRVSTFGESHGKALGVVVDGVPAGIELCEEDIQSMLCRRKPGQSLYTTKRDEPDEVELLSGVFEGKTLGTPIAMVVFNKDQKSKDYSAIKDVFRPGHADFGFYEKYGFRDYRGGGRSSGRETIGRVCAGAIAVKALKAMGVTVCTYTRSIGPVGISSFDLEEIFKNPLYMPDADAAKKAETYLNACMEEQDSAGGVVECVISGVPAGVGEPVFDKLDARLAQAVFSIGAVKGFEVGEGFGAALLKGSENNDAFVIRDKKPSKETNHAGGILGGISDGSDIVFRAAFKPTPSVACVQHTINEKGEEKEITITGRHDPVIVPRAVVVVESMAAITVFDMLLENMTSRISGIVDFYK